MKALFILVSFLVAALAQAGDCLSLTGTYMREYETHFDKITFLQEGCVAYTAITTHMEKTTGIVTGEVIKAQTDGIFRKYKTVMWSSVFQGEQLILRSIEAYRSSVAAINKTVAGDLAMESRIYDEDGKETSDESFLYIRCRNDLCER